MRNKFRNNGNFVCRKCSIANKPIRPQNTKEFWSDPKLRQKISESLKASDKLKESVKRRQELGLYSGEHNSMFGKSHTVDTKNKMSKSRTGKVGENATAWKGGSNSLNATVKKRINDRFKWSQRVRERDNWTCHHCASRGGNLDVHHILPMQQLISKYSNELDSFQTLNEKVEHLLTKHDIIDQSLENGITLCRSCHKTEHKNWGSHFPKVDEEI